MVCIEWECVLTWFYMYLLNHSKKSAFIQNKNYCMQDHVDKIILNDCRNDHSKLDWG